jgi:hypothetical protein
MLSDTFKWLPVKYGFLAVAIWLLGVCSFAADSLYSIRVKQTAALPMPVSNNAVTTVTKQNRQYVVSFAGLGAGRGPDDTLAVTLVLNSVSGEWRESTALPGRQGRLAATAASVDGVAYVFGGYTVAEDGSEISTPWVHAFDPATEEFSSRKDMPVPVDDAVSVTYRDRYIYLISGWHDLGNVNLTQRYDTKTDTWVQATPIPGTALFGHAGGIVGNRIVYCDGVAVRPATNSRREFVASDECFLGIIDEKDNRKIDWRRLDPHPGLPRYRMASAGSASLNAVLFIGGSENPYNYDGIGYNGEPSEPASNALFFDMETLTWQVLPLSNAPTMDHRGLVPFGDRWLTVGGMLANQKVTDQVIAYKVE